MRISTKPIILTTAVIISAAALFPKTVMAEKAMFRLKAPADSAMSAVANFEKECPNLANWLPAGPARERAIELAAARKGITYTPGTGTPSAAKAREEDVKPLASNTSAVDALYSKLNQYADLTPAERQKLDTDIAKSGDEKLIAAYADTKTKNGGVPASQPDNTSGGAVDKTAATAMGDETYSKVVETGTSASKATIAPSAEEKINELYGSINKYADLTDAERDALGKQVMETGNSDLIGTYNETKANYQPKATSPPAKETDGMAIEVEGAAQPETDAVLPALIVVPPTPEKVVKKPESQVTEESDATAPVVPKTAPRNLAALKDSLNTAINECYNVMNAMTPETVAADSAKVAGAMGEIRAIMDKSFPKNDPWAEYTWKNLSEYFTQSCEATHARKD